MARTPLLKYYIYLLKMSLEKKKPPEEDNNISKLQDSSFRQRVFTPLSEQRITQVVPVAEELTQIEKDVLNIAEKPLKLKRYDAEFTIETHERIQKYPIIELTKQK